jgi:hypothetical protein
MAVHTFSKYGAYALKRGVGHFDRRRSDVLLFVLSPKTAGLELAIV